MKITCYTKVAMVLILVNHVIMFIDTVTTNAPTLLQEVHCYI